MTKNLLLEREASDFRERNGIGASEPIFFKSWLRKLEVTTIFRPLSEAFSGMALKQDSQKYMIVNSNHRRGKQHFTIAHEIYHLYIQPDFHSEISYTGRFDKKDKVEYNADCFAAYLILPETGLKSLIPKQELGKNKISLETILKIEQFFACSRTALLYRLSELNLIDLPKYEVYKKNVIKSAIEFGFDTKLYECSNENLIIGDYGAKAKNLLDKGKISESHYISLMLDIGVDVSNFSEDEQE